MKPEPSCQNSPISVPTILCKRMLVNKAIFPVAGLGTRFLPATKAQPKEMLPVVDKPLIQYAVEEAYAAGVREMIFVTGRHKRPIEDHFDMTFELEVALEQAGKQELLSVVRRVKPDDMPGVFHEILNQPRGVGGEIQLTDGISSLLRREKVFAYRYEGRRYDCGSKDGFLQANVELALEHPVLGGPFRDYLRDLKP
jgi:UTP-glucose-1-phosphate uridylyltransferase